MKRSVLMAAVLLSACGPESLPPARLQQRAAIVGGSQDLGHPAVVGIQAFGLATYCSGTLIAPKTVLTAGHCANAAGSFSKYYVVFGKDDSANGIGVARQVRHPSYAGEGQPFDFALFELTSAQNVTPMPFARSAPTELVSGTPLTHVGFGSDGTGVVPLGDGPKRIVTTPITRVDSHFVYSGTAQQNTCSGDSGGAGLITIAGGSELLVSVVSDGPDCHSEGWDGRVDEVAAWIASAAAAWDAVPSPPAPSAPDASTPGPVSTEPDAGNSSEPAAPRGCSQAGALLSPLALLALLVAGRRSRPSRSR